MTTTNELELRGRAGSDEQFTVDIDSRGVSIMEVSETDKFGISKILNRIHIEREAWEQIVALVRRYDHALAAANLVEPREGAKAA